MAWRLNLRQMEAFRAVMLTGTTTHAARALNVSQPAVSRLIKDLEEHLTVSLFVRRQGRLQPTPEAEWLFQTSEEALERLDRLDTVVRDIRHVQARELRLMTTPPMAYGVLPDVLTAYQSLHPEVAVSVHIVVRRETRSWTSAQQFDVAVATFPIEYPEEAVERLVRVPGVCIVPDSHRLAKAEVIRAEDLEEEKLITLLPETLNRFRLDRIFENLGLKRQLAIETQTASSLCAYVGAGLGVAVIDPFTARRFLPLGIAVRPFLPRIDYEFGLLFPIRRPRTSAVDSFVPLVRDEIARAVEWYDVNLPGWGEALKATSMEGLSPREKD